MLLDTSADAVNSTLRRARAALPDLDRDSAPSQPSEDDRALLAAYIDAFERQDVDALVGLLRDDAIVEMPPFDLWLQGTEDIRQWLIAVNALADHLLTPVRANGSPAVAVYTPETPGGPPSGKAPRLPGRRRRAPGLPIACFRSQEYLAIHHATAPDSRAPIGSIRCMAAPRPGPSLAAQMRPPSASTAFAHQCRPMPWLVSRDFVENPFSKTRSS